MSPALSLWAWPDLSGRRVLWKIEIANEGAVMEIESCHGLVAARKKGNRSGKMEITQLLNISNTSKPGLSWGVSGPRGAAKGCRAFTTAEVPARFVTVSYLFWSKDLRV